MNRRRRSFLLAVTALVAAASRAFGQAAAALPRIAVLFLGSVDTAKANREAFIAGLREHGYVDGKNAVLDVNYAQMRLERLPVIITELLRRRPDVMVIPGAPAILAARQATTSVPIVMAISADPVGEGLVASLARPGGNVTGLASLTEVLVAKRLEILREVFPGATRFAYLTDPSSRSADATSAQAEAAAKRLGVSLARFTAANSDELDSALAAISTSKVGALLIAQDTLFNLNRKKIGEALARSRIPAMHSYSEATIDGGLMSLTPGSIAEFYRASARFVHRILAGASPGELPVEQPARFELIVNLKSAKALGIAIPQSVLLRADKVIN